MDIHLTLRRNPGNTFCGEAVYENIAGAFDFALDQNFAVRRITGPDGQACPFEKTHTMPDTYLDEINNLTYRKADIYRIAGEVPVSIKIEYESDGNFTSDIAYNRVSDEMIALDALYINFYPVPIARETTERIRPFQKVEADKEKVIEFGKLTFEIEGFEPYRAINEDGGYIKQFCKLVPFKLLAVDEGKILKSESGRATAYCFNEKESGKAAKIAEEASRIIDWYSKSLFIGQGAPEGPEGMYFISYNAKKLGGFNRSISIELERFYSPDTLRGMEFLAHEIAHYWCMSEPPAVWNEQMLAEGGAEWSHLLYCASRGRLYYWINYAAQAYKFFGMALYGRLHGNKIYNTHLHGYRFFKGVYKKHGRDALVRCIRYFNQIEVKTMESFLQAVKENEPAQVYAFVEKLALKNLK